MNRGAGTSPASHGDEGRSLSHARPPRPTGLPYTTAILDDLAVIYAVAKVAGIPCDLSWSGYSTEQIEAHLRDHGVAIAQHLAGLEHPRDV